MQPVYSYDHIHLRTRDPEGTIAFYEKMFDAKPTGLDFEMRGFDRAQQKRPSARGTAESEKIQRPRQKLDPVIQTQEKPLVKRLQTLGRGVWQEVCVES